LGEKTIFARGSVDNAADTALMFNTQKNQVKQHTALGLTAQKSPQQSQAG
jgi:hypothetical protein